MFSFTKKHFYCFYRIPSVAALLLLMHLFSCNSKNSDTTGISNPKKVSQTEYTWEKVDSFKVDRMTKFIMLDYNTKNQKFLAYDGITQEYLILDKKGNILQSVKRNGDGPNEYATLASAASFNHESDGYYVQTSNEFIAYNQNWEVIKRTKFSPYYGVNLYSGPRVKTPYYKSSEKEPYFFASLFSGVGIFQMNKPEDWETTKLLEYYSPKLDSIKWALPLDKGLFMPYVFEKPNHYINQIYTIDDKRNLLYLTFQNGQAIGVYDMENEFKQNSKLPISHQHFMKSNQSKNRGLFRFDGDLIGLLYYKGISEGAEQIRKEVNPNYSAFEDPSLYSFILFNKTIQLEKELPFPQNASPRSHPIVLPDNCILVMDKQNNELEEEFSTYSIYQLKKIN